MDVKLSQKISVQDLAQEQYEKYKNEQKENLRIALIICGIILGIIAYGVITTVLCANTIFKNESDPYASGVAIAIGMPILLGFSLPILIPLMINIIRCFIQNWRIYKICRNFKQLPKQTFTSLAELQAEIKRLSLYDYYQKKFKYVDGEVCDAWWTLCGWGLSDGGSCHDWRFSEYLAKTLKPIYMPLLDDLLSQSSWKSLSPVQQKAVRIKLEDVLEERIGVIARFCIAPALGQAKPSNSYHPETVITLDIIEQWIKGTEEYYQSCPSDYYYNKPTFDIK